MPVRVKSTDLVYFPVPKIACSSIKYVLLNHNKDGMADRLPLTSKLRGRISNPHDYYPARLFRPWYSLQYGARKWICVVRDPLQRFLSGFSNRIQYHQDLLKHGYPEALDKKGLSQAPDLEEFVDCFERYSHNSRHVKQHFRPMCDFLGKDPEKFFKVISFDRLPEIEKLFAQNGLTISLPHLQAGGTRISADQLGSRAKSKLLKLFEEDYTIWGRYL